MQNAENKLSSVLHETQRKKKRAGFLCEFELVIGGKEIYICRRIISQYDNKFGNKCASKITRPKKFINNFWGPRFCTQQTALIDVGNVLRNS